MCLYLAPRWRRRPFGLILALALALLLRTGDARTLPKTENIDSKAITSDGDAVAGLVTTSPTQSNSTVTTRARKSDSNRNASQNVSNDKSVLFDTLVKVTTPSTIQKHLSIKASSMDCGVLSRSPLDGKTNRGDSKQDDGDKDDVKGSSDDVKGSSDDVLSKAGAKSSSDSKSSYDKFTNKTGATNEATAPVPTSRTTLPLPPAAPSLRLDSRLQEWSSSTASPKRIADEEFNFIDNTEVLENETKSAFSTTENRSLDHTLVAVIIGVVGTIGSLLMIVSRKVMKETDDDKDMEDSSIF